MKAVVLSQQVITQLLFILMSVTCWFFLMIFDPYLMPRPLSVLKYNESAIIIFSKSTYETFALVSQLKSAVVVCYAMVGQISFTVLFVEFFWRDHVVSKSKYKI